MKLKAVYNKKFGQWKLCHDQWCQPGETSVVAHVLTTLDDADEKWAKLIESRFNMTEDFEAKALEMIANVQPIPIMGDDDSIHLTDKQEGYVEGLRAAINLMKEMTCTPGH